MCKTKKRSQVKCPKCNKKGGVRARKDAYADFKIMDDGKWLYDSTAVMDEVQAVECFKCGSEFTLKDVEKHNDI